MMELLTQRRGVVVYYEADPDAEGGRRRVVDPCRVCKLDPCPVEEAQQWLDRTPGNAS